MYWVEPYGECTMDMATMINYPLIRRRQILLKYPRDTIGIYLNVPKLYAKSIYFIYVLYPES